MKIFEFIQQHVEVITVMTTLIGGYISLKKDINKLNDKWDSRFNESDNRWYTLLNKIHEIDKRMEVKFTQVDASLNQGK